MSQDPITDILTERGKNYGPFFELAEIAQAIKRLLRAQPGWDQLSADMQEALEVDATKTARILNGNPRHLDSWDDKAGYARLVADRLRGVVR